ncbi:MAG: glycosyltransferase family 4 protein [Candidatus Micrarchaeia archaeon]
MVTSGIIQKLSARNSVVFFTSQYKGMKSEEAHKNLKIIRRGSIFTVYIHAFAYMLRNRDFDFVIESVSTVPFFSSILFGDRSIIIPHHLMGRLVFGELPFYKAIFAYTAEKLIPLLYRKSQFIAVSKYVSKVLSKMGIPKERIHIAHPSTSRMFDTLCNRKSYSKFSNPTVLVISRLVRYKRVGLLIKLFSRLPKRIGARLIVIGSGKERKKLEKLASKLGVQNRVDFVGSVSEERKIYFLRKSWVFAFTSRIEGFGIIAVEAQKCGVPVVAFGVGGIPEAVKNRYSGFVIDEGDEEDFVDKLAMLLINKELREKMSHNAIRNSKKFIWTEIPNMVCKIISQKGPAQSTGPR